ncbi:hypothetical protein [Halorubrum sp. LN27]|nr:hypothetical protein [Halorubrum sp. LN27]
MHPAAPIVAIVAVLLAVAVLGMVLCPPEGPYAIFYWWVCNV